MYIQSPPKTGRKALTHLLSPLLTFSTPLSSLLLGTKEALCCGGEVKHGTRFCPFKQMGNGNMADDGPADNELKLCLKPLTQGAIFLSLQGDLILSPFCLVMSHPSFFLSLFDRWSVRRSSDLGFLPRFWVPRQNSHCRWSCRVQYRSALRRKEVWT